MLLPRVPSRVSNRPRRRRITVLPMDPAASAEVSGLRYVCDRDAGIRRRKIGKGFRYVSPQGMVLKDPAQLRRIGALVIPPAWTDVWICARPDGHLQAVGRDSRGRKQYRYHSLYRQVRNQTKFRRMASFAEALPGIRRRVESDLRQPGLSKVKVLATLVKLLEATCIRIGNEEYVEQNESFGLTTLRNRHVKIGEHTMRFHFKGKSGQVHRITLSDRRLARIVHHCQSLPGQKLFEYLEEDGAPTPVSSEDVNQYLRELSGEEFTAKDFRTWIGTTEAVLTLETMGTAASVTEAKKNVVEMVKTVAAKLGNRPATCKTYYIHPAIPEAYVNGSFFDLIRDVKPRENSLRREEAAALAIIEKSESEAGNDVVNGARRRLPILKQPLISAV